ncbi:MAG: hypothetical protein AAFZ07_28345 [Actinomycetota bacterium]
MESSTTPPRQPILRYFFDSWIQTCGPGWTRSQVAIGYAVAAISVPALLVYAAASDLHWSWIQMVAASWIVWDLVGGAIGYSHAAIKRRRAGETSIWPPLHHNLVHTHPLVLVYFESDPWLFGLTVYSMITFFGYVELLEVIPATGRRRIGEAGQRAVVGIEIMVAAALMAVSFFVPAVTTDHRTWGITVYVGLGLLTLAVVATPLPFQRATATIGLVAMVFIGMHLDPPDGFQWLIPVYFLKLLIGFTAREDTQAPPTPAPSLQDADLLLDTSRQPGPLGGPRDPRQSWPR